MLAVNCTFQTLMCKTSSDIHVYLPWAVEMVTATGADSAKMVQ